MNRKSKVIVSIVGITIVLLALLGLTYAYYLTRIEGNTNTNSISITTADLKLVYRDGNGLVSKENIMPGTTIEKTFTVTNDGNNRVDNYAVYLEELTNTLSRTEDLTYVLECVSTGAECVGGSGEFPQLAGIIATNSIDTGVTHTYKLTVTYANLDDVDQSDDMGSIISAFVQIYAMADVLDIEGTVTGTSDGDYAQINSVQKRSMIVDGKYKFAGVLPGTHTIKICGVSDEICASPKLTKQIEVKVGTTAGVSGNTITMTEDSQEFNIDLNVSTGEGTLGTEVKDYNPFNEGTLAYNIYKNTKENKNGTGLVLDGSVESRVGIEPARAKYGKMNPTLYPSTYTTTVFLPDTPPLSSVEPKDLYIAYACDYSIDENGMFTLGTNDCPVTTTPTKYVKTTEMINNIKGKFAILSYSLPITTNNVEEIIKITDKENEFTDTNFHYAKIYKYINDERIVATTSDEYGISYYYRGDVEDNYVNFADMCWRIVRVEGDGSTKLILEDQDELCSLNMNGNWDIPLSNDINSPKVGSFGNKRILINESLGIYETQVNFNEPENPENSMITAFKNFQTNKLSSYFNKLRSGEWCYNDKLNVTGDDIEYYDSYTRLVNSSPTVTLKCNGTKLNKFNDNITPMYVGTLTADEVVFAGVSSYQLWYAYLYPYYLVNGYQLNNQLAWYTLSPKSTTEPFTVYYAHIFYYNSGQNSFRPAVNLKTNIKISGGNGTLSNPYVIG